MRKKEPETSDKFNNEFHERYFYKPGPAIIYSATLSLDCKKRRENRTFKRFARLL